MPFCLSFNLRFSLFFEFIRLYLIQIFSIKKKNCIIFNTDTHVKIFKHEFTCITAREKTYGKRKQRY